MIKSLFIIAGASFVLAAVCFAGAAALGGGNWMNHHWGRSWWVNWDDDRWGHFHDGVWGGRWNRDNGPSASRDIAWSGADGLDLELPADVTFTQAAGPAKLTVTGPSDVINHVALSGSHLRFDEDDWWGRGGRVSVVLTAPNVHRFSINGDGSLAIGNYDQDQLDVEVSGHGEVTAKGKARAAHLDISGDGDVDLGGLATDSADADISGSGRASIAPASAADLRISGSGEIDLLTRPAKLTSDVSGSGRIVEGAAVTTKAD
jgi:hypothetical protein